MIGEASLWMEVLLWGGVFLGALLAFEGLRQATSRTETIGQARNRRMRLIASGTSTEERLRLLKPEEGAGRFSPVRVVARLLRKAGVTVTAQIFLAACGLATVSTAVVVGVVAGVPLGLVLGPVLGLAVPLMVVNRLQVNRSALLDRQLPEALDLMARGLHVGHPLNATIRSVADDMADPVASEFGVMVDQIAYGDALVDAFADFATRIDTEDAHYLATAVAIQHGTGGDLATVLRTLAKVIRDRAIMRKRIHAISSEGRLTAVFLSFLPVFIFMATMVTSPGYYSGVMDDPLFRYFAVAVVFLTVVNFLAMRSLVRFKF